MRNSRYITLTAILLNTVFIALQMDESWNLQNVFLITLLDRIITGVFVMEVLLKWYYGFFNFWKSAWNIFDFLIVVFQLLAVRDKYAESRIFIFKNCA